MTLYLIDWQNNKKKISRSEAVKIAGPGKFNEMVSEAKETFLRDPKICNEFMVSGGRLGFKF